MMKNLADGLNVFKKELKSTKEPVKSQYGYHIILKTDEKEKPELKDAAASWFHSKWGVPKEAYLECMNAYLNRN